MTAAHCLKPTDKAINAYYEALAAYTRQDVSHEMAVRSAFQNLLDDVGRRFGWTLIPELGESAGGIRPDGTFRDDYYIARGHWEAKDSQDDLEKEVRAKIAKGYPLGNIIFEDTRQGCLYQNGQLAFKADLTKPQALADLLNAFFTYIEPAHEDFGKAIDEFKGRVPDLARGLVQKINDAHRNNRRFIEAFDQFYELCRNSLNPNLRLEAVDEMLVQHLLTERLLRTIFDNQDFTRRNVVAAEIEKVIDALVSKSFDRQRAALRQRGDAPALLHRRAEHRTRLLRSHRGLRALRGTLLCRYTGLGGAETESFSVHDGGEHGSREATEGGPDHRYPGQPPL